MIKDITLFSEEVTNTNNKIILFVIIFIFFMSDTWKKNAKKNWKQFLTKTSLK